MRATLVINLAASLIPLSIFVWSVFMPHAGGYSYVAIYIFLQLWLILLDSNRPSPDPETWTPEEIAILQKYHLALKFPFGSKILSCILNRFRWIGLLLLAPLAFWNQMWVTASVLVLSFFTSGPVSLRLDPFFFLGDAVKHGKVQFVPELDLLNRVYERMWLGKIRCESNIDRQSRSHEYGNVIIQCKNCGQKLRLPVQDKILKVTCPACKYIFFQNQTRPE